MAFLAESGLKKYFFQGPYSGGDPGLKQWWYITVDNLATITTAGYIDNTTIIRSLSVGDYIKVFQVTDRNDLSTQTVTFQLVVTAKTASTASLAVTPAATATTITITDTTIAALNAAANAINTTNKTKNKFVADENERVYRALGTTTTSKWRPLDDQSGISDITPA